MLGTEEVVHFWLVDPADGVKASIVELDDFVGVSLEVQLQAALLEVRTRRAKGLPCARRSASAPPGVAFSSDDDRRLADVEGGSVDHLDRDRSGIAHEGLDAGVADGGGADPSQLNGPEVLQISTERIHACSSVVKAPSNPSTWLVASSLW